MRKKTTNTLFGGTVETNSQVDYMIDLRYGQKDWDMSSALREVIANAIDTRTKYERKWENGVATISDAGPGLPKSAFVMGASSKASDANQIGMFGEGLKMCVVTCLRHGKKISIRTKGYGVEAESFRSKEYGSDMMRILFTDASIDSGTEIKIECDEEEYRKAEEMFLQLREGYRRLDRGIFLPAGCVCILGLATEERNNLLFSYDVGDKTMTNRDRNVVKTRKFREEVARILSGMKKPEAIGLWFDGLSEKPDSEEYKIPFEPKKKDEWLAVVADKYGEDVAFSSSPDGDVKAAYKGIKVIPCPTKHVRAVLTSLGLKSSAMKTRAVKNEDVVVRNEAENKIVYPIARDYVKDWTVISAGRELVANAIDMSGNATVEFEDGRCVVEDSGTGVERRHFVIGNSSKTEDRIGMFGEGFKLASLVLARENRDMVMETVGSSYRPALEMSKDFGTEVFCFAYEDNDRKVGTRISFVATEEETEEIRNLFICFRDDVPTIVSTPEVDVIDDGQESVYVNGLFVAETKSLFTYNVKGMRSAVDGRDRNHVDEALLSEVLTRFWNEVSDERTISRFLTGWEENSYAREYSLVVEPNDKAKWNSVVAGCYRRACFSSVSSRKADFVAETAGYKVLRNVPPYVMRVMSETIETADEVAERYGDGGIQTDDKITFPLTADYVMKWSRADALRELIANAMDACPVDKIRISHRGAVAEIEDAGKGLRKENLVIGNSGSRNVGTAIGTFGEGLKMACLALCKGGRRTTIETVGFTVEAQIERSKVLESDVLTMKVSENDRTVGTKIVAFADEVDLVEAKNRFLAFDDEKTRLADGLYEGGKPAVYVNGVMVTDLSNLGNSGGIGFSYDFDDPFAKKALSRDRNSFTDKNDCWRRMFAILTDVRDRDLMKRILTELTDRTEEGFAFSSCCWTLSSSTKNRWKRAALDAFPNSCLPSYSDENTLAATDSGITVLRNMPGCLLDFLRAIGFPQAEEAVRLAGEKRTRETAIPLKSLTPEERLAHEILTKMVESEFGKSMPSKMKVVACLDGGKFAVESEYAKETDTVFLIRRLLNPAPDRMRHSLGAVAKAFEARSVGAPSRSKALEDGLADRLGGLYWNAYGSGTASAG